MHSYVEDMLLLKESLEQAAKIAMAYFRTPLKQWLKNDKSPVSEADIKINEYLEKTLLKARPSYGWISEETLEARVEARRNFIVDPIDGTRGFLAHEMHWCIGVAIQEQNKIVAAAIICPALGEIYYGTIDGEIYFNDKIFVSQEKAAGEKLTLALPRKLLQKINQEQLVNISLYPYVSSLLYKIILCARGLIDVIVIYPTCKIWDLATAALFLHRMQGKLLDIDNQPVIYTYLGSYENYLFAYGNNIDSQLIELELKNIIS